MKPILVAVTLLLTFTTSALGQAQRAVEATAAEELGSAWQQAAPTAVGGLGRAADGRQGLPVTVQFALLRRAAADGGVLRLPLPDGNSVRLTISWAELKGAEGLVAGPLLDAEGEASLTIVGNTLSGRIVANGHLFMVRRVAETDTHVVIEIDAQSLPLEAPPLEPPLGAAPAAVNELVAQADTNAFVDVMIVYTPAARVQIGGTSAMVAELIGAVNNANVALATAGVVHRFRLVHYQEIAYAETGDMGVSLNHLTTPGDGYMDTVQALRDFHRADVVSLLTADVNACGLAWVMSTASSAFERLAYNVSLWSCANAGLTLAHEIGHNMGLVHDWENSGTTLPASSYGYGYRISGVARDVMAYQCPISCPRRTIFSTPRVNFPGTSLAAGTPIDDAARALNDWSLLVANFRQSTLPPVITTQPVSQTIFGTSVTLCAAATGSSLTYQWYLGTSGTTTTPIAGATSACYTTPVLTTTTHYWVRVSNAGGSTNSATATITPRVPGDMNVDGMSDLVWRHSTTGTIVIWYLNGTTVTTQSSLLAGADPAWQLVATGDVNRDGRLDLFWRNTATNSTVVWYLNGTTVLGGENLPQVDRSWVIGASSDVNRDGSPDVIWRDLATGANIVWYLNGASIAGYTSLPTVTDQSWQIAASADLNQDGSPDVIWRNLATGANLVWYLVNGTYAGFANLPPVSDLTWQLAGAFDVNRDQSTDLIWRNTLTGANLVWYMSGATFLSSGNFPSVSDPTWRMMGTQLPDVPSDVNGDRRPDLIWRNVATGANYVWYMNGVTLLAHGALPSVLDLTWQIAARADVNGDQHPDIIWRNTVSGANLVWFLNGTSIVGSASLPTVADTHWQMVAAADLNADTRPDLIWRHRVSGANVVWYLNGATVLGATGLPTAADSAWKIVDAADMNGDAYPDLVWRNTSTGENAVWYLKGASFLSDASLPSVVDLAWQMVAVADANGDGHPDLVWRNTATGANAVWCMNGTTFLSHATLPTMSDLNWTLRAPRS